MSIMSFSACFLFSYLCSFCKDHIVSKRTNNNMTQFALP